MATRGAQFRFDVKREVTGPVRVWKRQLVAISEKAKSIRSLRWVQTDVLADEVHKPPLKVQAVANKDTVNVPTRPRTIRTEADESQRTRRGGATHSRGTEEVTEVEAPTQRASSSRLRALADTARTDNASTTLHYSIAATSSTPAPAAHATPAQAATAASAARASKQQPATTAAHPLRTAAAQPTPASQRASFGTPGGISAAAGAAAAAAAANGGVSSAPADGSAAGSAPAAAPAPSAAAPPLFSFRAAKPAGDGAAAAPASAAAPGMPKFAFKPVVAKPAGTGDKPKFAFKSAASDKRKREDT